MAFKAGDTVFIVESNRFIREAEVRSCSGGMYLVKFKDNGQTCVWSTTYTDLEMYRPNAETNSYKAQIERIYQSKYAK